MPLCPRSLMSSQLYLCSPRFLHIIRHAQWRCLFIGWHIIKVWEALVAAEQNQSWKRFSCQELEMNCDLWLSRADRFITGTVQDADRTGTTVTYINCTYWSTNRRTRRLCFRGFILLFMHLCSVRRVWCFARSWQDRFVSVQSEDSQSSPQFGVAAEHSCESSRVTTDLIFSLLPQMRP